MRSILIAFAIFFTGTIYSFSAPKNIILLIGDGMDEAQIAMARAYEFDGKPMMFMDQMKNRGSVIVNQLLYEDPTKIQFAGESSSGATTIATGKRTTAMRVAIDAFDGSHLKTILEEAQERGFKTGIVSTARMPDATQASFTAHAQIRYCFVMGQDECKRFNDTPILEQMIDRDLDVMLAGGTRYLYAPETGGKTIGEKAFNQGFKVITTRTELLNLDPGTKTYGAFGEDNVPPEWVGPNGMGAREIKLNEAGTEAVFDDPAHCEPNPIHNDIPTLEEMSKFAIESLKNDDKGFFLMVEGAQTDKEAHEAHPCGSISDLLAFDRTVRMAVDYAKELGDTAVIVTADHGQAAQVIFTPEVYYPPATYVNAKGLLQVLLTKGGNPLFTYYGTNNADAQSHTGVNVPIYTFGLDDPDPLTGVIEQIDIYPVMKNFLFE